MRSIDVEPELAEYWAGIEQDRVLIRHCEQCQAHLHPRRMLCPGCGSTELAWTPASGDGEIYSYTVLDHYAVSAEYQAALPYAVGFVRLREGIYLFGRLLSVDLSRITVGAPARAVVRRLEEGAKLLAFTVGESAAEG